ncbi:MAG: metallophosphoesterase [Chloroflexota bacterium]
MTADGTTTAEPLERVLWAADPDHTARRTVVLSDVHLGVDDAFAENTHNRGVLIDFFERVVASGADEIVLAGDLLDEWFVPATYPRHTDSRAFYRRIRDNNPAVFAAFNAIVASGVSLVYVPGNHDMLLDEDTLAELVPGIRQARDSAGLGRHRTGARNEVVIEHGHRYHAGAAPDPLSNKEFTGAYPSILPPGYLWTRLATTSVVEGKSAQSKALPPLPATDDLDEDQRGARAYHQLWASTIGHFAIGAELDDPVFDIAIDGYDGTFSVADLLPALREDGTVAARLYADVQRRWDAIQEANGVAVKLPFTQALTMAMDSTLLDRQAVTQYFDVDPDTDVVVFGHSHTPVLTHFPDGFNRPKTYANTGTWIDKNPLRSGTTFVAIASGADATDVRVLRYEPDGSIAPAEDVSAAAAVSASMFAGTRSS